MASPFPGMDPYLEHPARWGGVHGGLISVLRELLTRQVRPRFFVDSEDHVYIIDPADPGRGQVRPDIFVAETAAVATARRDREPITPPVVFEVPRPLRVRYGYLTVRDSVSRQVVAVIEVLSPINKAAGSEGLDDFRRKRQQVWASTAHWIEIDLLRAGTRTLEVNGPGSYYAALHRARPPAEDRLEVWFIGLRDALPTIAVPLVDSLPDAPLNLQEAITIVYERYGYEADIDYTTPPPAPALPPDDAAWAAECIRRWRVAPPDQGNHA